MNRVIRRFLGYNSSVRFLLRWVLLALSVLAASWICGALGLGFEANAKDIVSLLIGTAILALLNATLGSILQFLGKPISCLTFGLFSWVISALVLIVAASAGFGFRFTTEGGAKFLAAVVAAVLIAAINGMLTKVVLRDKDSENQAT